MSDNQTKVDLGRLRTYIYQGEIKKMKRFLNNHPNRVQYLIEHEQFDACAFATKFKQEKALDILHNFGKYSSFILL